jgi:hypothetical protein
MKMICLKKILKKKNDIVIHLEQKVAVSKLRQLLFFILYKRESIYEALNNYISIGLEY